MKHSHVPLPQIAGELGLVDRFTILEGLPEEGVGIQARNHVVEGFCLLQGHTEEGQQLGARFVMFLVLIGLKRGNGAIQKAKPEFSEKVYTGKSFKVKAFISWETSSC